MEHSSTANNYTSLTSLSHLPLYGNTPAPLHPKIRFPRTLECRSRLAGSVFSVFTISRSLLHVNANNKTSRNLSIIQRRKPEFQKFFYLNNSFHQNIVLNNLLLLLSRFLNNDHARLAFLFFD
jgi:uncharacterized membrane protein SpoIIM required for sporulation